MKNSSDINDARYEKFCTKVAMPEPHQLPPTHDAFHWHLQRAHYTALTWKSVLQCDPIIPSPEGYGWTVSAQNHLQIYWTSLPPAPDAVLNMIPCACTKSKCAAGGCSCLSLRLKCTDLCKCKNCENTPDESDDSDDNFDKDEIDTDSSDALE